MNGPFRPPYDDRPPKPNGAIVAILLVCVLLTILAVCILAAVGFAFADLLAFL